MILLSSGQSAGIVNEAGEEEGCAWLSPIREERKKDLVFKPSRQDLYRELEGSATYS